MKAKRFVVGLFLVMLTSCSILPQEATGETHDVCILGYKYRAIRYSGMEIISELKPVVDRNGKLITCVIHWTD